MHRKATGFVTNCKGISIVLRRRCSGEHEHEVIIGGKVLELAQRYHKSLIDQILGAYQKSIGETAEMMSFHNVVAENRRLDQLMRDCLQGIQEEDLSQGEEHHSPEVPGDDGELRRDAEHLPHCGVCQDETEFGGVKEFRASNVPEHPQEPLVIEPFDVTQYAHMIQNTKNSPHFEVTQNVEVDKKRLKKQKEKSWQWKLKRNP